MIVTTTENVRGSKGEIVPCKTLNRVFGITTVAPSAFANWKTGFRNFVGGESKSYNRIVEKSRRLAMEHLEANAKAMGADAIVMLRFDSDAITTDLESVVAYGTAVKFLE